MTTTPAKPAMTMGSPAEQRALWSNYPWPEAGDEWSKNWGGSAGLWFGLLYPRLRHFLPLNGQIGHVLEIACGHGRVTQYLAPHAARYTGIDLVEKCVAYCKERFAGREGWSFHLTDGKSLDMVEDASVDLAFSWDSLVHCDHDVMEAYAHGLARKLRPGAVAVLHHSNFGEDAPRLPKEVVQGRNHRRTPTMSAALMRQFCRDAGLAAVVQEIVPWGGSKFWLDSLTTIVRPGGDRNAPGAGPGTRWATLGDVPECKVVYREDWPTEMQIVRRDSVLYAAVTGEEV
ncbi:MAG: class I SAM-dependent methyltransferase [Phycisphaerales bacterium]|nr:class I SAM-dependent methyltransferase [Phycisphaerales bacterium]